MTDIPDFLRAGEIGAFGWSLGEDRTALDCRVALSAEK